MRPAGLQSTTTTCGLAPRHIHHRRRRRNRGLPHWYELVPVGSEVGGEGGHLDGEHVPSLAVGIGPTRGGERPCCASHAHIISSAPALKRSW